MNFFSEISNEQFLFKIEQVLDRSLDLYSENRHLQKLGCHLSFLHKILINADTNIKPMIINTNALVYVKAMEKSLDYVLTILYFLQGIVSSVLIRTDSHQNLSQSAKGIIVMAYLIKLS